MNLVRKEISPTKKKFDIRVYDERELNRALCGLKPGQRICYHERLPDSDRQVVLSLAEKKMFERIAEKIRLGGIMPFIARECTALGRVEYYIVQGVNRRHQRTLDQFFEEKKEKVPQLELAA